VESGIGCRRDCGGRDAGLVTLIGSWKGSGDIREIGFGRGLYLKGHISLAHVAEAETVYVAYESVSTYVL
jgi:hypothetical protein